MLSPPAEPATTSTTTPTPTPQPPSVLAMQVETHADALNLIITFLRIANKRGAFTLEESSKIYSCIQMFEKPLP